MMMILTVRLVIKKDNSGDNKGTDFDILMRYKSGNAMGENVLMVMI